MQVRHQRQDRHGVKGHQDHRRDGFTDRVRQAGRRHRRLPVPPVREAVQVRDGTLHQLHTARRRVRTDALPHHQGYIVAVPSHTAGQGGGSHAHGSQGRAQVQLQTFAARPEDRSENTHAAKHRRRAAAVPEGQGQVQGVGQRDCVENQEDGGHERNTTVRGNRSAGDGHKEEMDKTADLNELRSAVCALWIQSQVFESV